MRYQFELIGQTPLIIHADDVEKSDELKEYRDNPKNRRSLVNGDDRHPAWSWQTYIYTDGTSLVMPAENVMAALRKAGAQMKLKGKSTLKGISQSAMAIVDEYCELRGPKGVVSLADVLAFRDEPFAEHVKRAKKLGISFRIKRLPVGQAKHVRVRPVLDEWTVVGRIETFDEVVSGDMLQQLFEIAGHTSGLGNFRPSAPKCPGPYGTFTAKITPIKGK